MFGGWSSSAARLLRRSRMKQLLVEVVGMPAKQAMALIKEDGFEVAILSDDGTVCATDGQFDSDRIGIVVYGGVVKGAQVG